MNRWERKQKKVGGKNRRLSVLLWLFFLIGAADMALAANLARTVWQREATWQGEMRAAQTQAVQEPRAAQMQAAQEPRAARTQAAQEPRAAQAQAAQASQGEEASPKYLALTFDDGPHPQYTEELLDGLKERGVKASFFLVGKSLAGNEELVLRMKEEGHLIGTHCYSHVDLTKEEPEEACRQIFETNKLIENITGESPVYIRPPYGKWSDALRENLDMSPVFWDIDTLDWKSQDSAAVLRVIEKNAGKHQIVLMHDTFPSTVEATLAAIDRLKEQGYEFVTVDELLID